MNIQYAYYTNVYIELIRTIFIKLCTNGLRKEIIIFLSKNRAKTTSGIWNSPIMWVIYSFLIL